MKYTYKQIKDSLTKKKNSRSSLWIQLWVRKFSFPITYVFINTGWSANQVSVLSWIVIFIAAVCLSINNFWWMLAGALLTNFWLVLDCVDGNIARVKKLNSFMGDYFDAVAGYGPFSFTTMALGIDAYNTSTFLPEEYRCIFLIIGGVAAFSNLYMRLIHQKYLNCYFAAKKILGELDDITLKDTEDKRSFAYIREAIDKNLGVNGVFQPWIIIAVLTSSFDIMLCFYSLYYIVSFLAISILYSIKASKYEIEAQEKRRMMDVNKNLQLLNSYGEEV